ncbi:bifunctional protein-serine/threonine kinase/phosphatase [Neptuniibacter pectenicola]|uniref:bifunctional protein-serine/threonine kinase/phosphatase n=1 Tax=Neptuniibacter pectenicola TaxID=1806669 RepID=UPI00082C3A90|nr:bifunctional protein-serine/threonine kinase/phosphatase [Neptuniibacter pectenicola]
MSKKTLALRFGGKSSAGRKKKNQDAFAAHLPSHAELDFKGGAAAIADGVSSCEDSHIASQTSVTSFMQDYFSTPHSWSVKNSVSRVLTALNSWLHKENIQNSREKDSLLCTFSALIIKSNTLHWFHVGDSRIYHFQAGQLEQLTQDHVRKTGGKHYLSRALGGDQHLDVDYATSGVKEGDMLLMTTDGIHEFLSNRDLQAILAEHFDSPETAAQQCIDLALERGSDDNLTALITCIDHLPSETLDESHARLAQLPIPPVMAIGNKIDDYEVLDIIFSGTRSHMYLVKDTASGQQYVLKAPSLQFAEDPLYLDGFIREEWVGQRIDHPNVMKTFPPLREKQYLYYLGEHIQGMNLREWMNDNPAPKLDEVRDLTKQVIQGLRAFQRADMVHQDLKPENIMINQDGRIKILDFGTVKIAGIEEMNSPLDKSIPQGSINYVAPEYLLGEAGSFRSDLFSLAVIVYEMITGHLPYKEMKTNNITLKNYGQMHYTPTLHYRKGVPLWVEGCLKKALQPNPRFRYEALSEFLQDLTQPNQSLEAKIKHQPMLEKNPILTWQMIAALMLILNLIQLLLK